jgi:hypothetical protein
MVGREEGLTDGTNDGISDVSSDGSGMGFDGLDDSALVKTTAGVLKGSKTTMESVLV